MCRRRCNSSSSSTFTSPMAACRPSAAKKSISSLVYPPVLVTRSPADAGGSFYNNVPSTGSNFVVVEDNSPNFLHDKEFIAADSFAPGASFLFTAARSTCGLRALYFTATGSFKKHPNIGVAPPSFVFFTNVATTFHFSYTRFLVNQLRERFGFVGTPIRVQVRRRAKRERPGR